MTGHEEGGSGVTGNRDLCVIIVSVKSLDFGTFYKAMLVVANL